VRNQRFVDEEGDGVGALGSVVSAGPQEAMGITTAEDSLHVLEGHSEGPGAEFTTQLLMAWGVADQVVMKAGVWVALSGEGLKGEDPAEETT
jgi:hypothetical protein